MSKVVIDGLPKGWTSVPLKDAVHVVLGQSPASSTYNYEKIGLPFFQGKTEFGNIYPTVMKWCDEPKKIAEKEDVLVSVRAPVGPTNLAPYQCAIGRGLAALRPLDGSNSRYFLYLIRRFERELAVLGTGTTFEAINGDILKNFTVPIAPSEQQKHIVAKIEELFSHIDAGIEALNKAKQLLKQYRQSVLKAAVTGELTKDWREQRMKDDVQGSTSAAGAGSAGAAKLEPASKLLERILKERRQKWEEQQLEQFEAKGKMPKNDKWKEKYKEPELSSEKFFGEIPTGWGVSSIDHLAWDVRYGSSSKTNDDEMGVPVLRMGNIVDGHLDYSNLKYLPQDHKEFPDLLVSDGDLIFNRTNSAELVGKTAIYRDIGKATSLASYLIRIKLLDAIEPDYVAFIINSAIGRAWIKSCVSQNVGQANVNGTKLKAFVVPVPPSEEQAEIVKLVKEKYESSQRLMRELKVQLIKAEKNKQSILASAFSGRIL